ncbi:MAG: glycosyl transferase family 1 [Herpetosiphonaceae bacterium]|nr:MAG: glycosyl transferase family 1 [Herpetosiphonaceae bacterium]
MVAQAKRILICAAQVPFSRGGAEGLVEGLRCALHEAGYIVDVVALPYTWSPHRELLSSLLAWRMLDLTQAAGAPVDQIICTKFPSYAANHPRKVVWLVHQHRQIYDWYGTGMSDWGAEPGDRELRKTVMRIDRQVLSEAQRRYTISRNVGQRLARFSGLSSETLYPPSPLAGRLRQGPYGDTLLAVMPRLDPAKRPELLIEALALTTLPIKCVITGDGPNRERLERWIRRCGLGERVRLAGFVSDDELIKLYEHARAVYYAPVDEDYGFVTIEALGSARPVVTLEDAGGVLEFVHDGENGLVAPPNASALAATLDRLWSSEGLTERLGAAGPAAVSAISWRRVIDTLVL